MSRVTEINGHYDHDYIINNNKYVIIFFGSHGCSFCRNMTPVFDKMSTEYPHVIFAHIDVSKVDTENLSGVPAFVGYKDRIPIGVVSGAKPRELKDMIEKNFI